MLKDRTWLTEDTLIRGVDGWVKINEFKNIDYVIGFDNNNKYHKVSVKEINRFFYDGIISKNKNKDICLNSYNLVDDFDSKTILKHYNGYVYNIVTSNNTIIATTEDSNNYKLLLCQIAN